jgi:hypothetical protein
VGIVVVEIDQVLIEVAGFVAFHDASPSVLLMFPNGMTYVSMVGQNGGGEKLFPGPVLPEHIPAGLKPKRRPQGRRRRTAAPSACWRRRLFVSSLFIRRWTGSRRKICRSDRAEAHRRPSALR